MQLNNEKSLLEYYFLDLSGNQRFDAENMFDDVLVP